MVRLVVNKLLQAMRTYFDIGLLQNVNVRTCYNLRVFDCVRGVEEVRTPKITLCL